MTSLLVVAAVLMLLSAVLLLADVGAAGLWIAIIVVCLALVVIASRSGGKLIHR
jgi:hypothetical protein